MEYHEIWGALAAFCAGGTAAGIILGPIGWDIMLILTAGFTIAAFAPISHVLR